MGHNDWIMDRIAKRFGYILTYDRVKEVSHDHAVGEYEAPTLSVFVIFKEGDAGPHDPKLSVAIAKRNGHNPINFGSPG